MTTKQTKQAVQGGFTLIELMVVVAIIGILAAVGIAAYQNNIAKVKAAAAYADIAAGRSGYELAVQENTAASDVQYLARSGLAEETHNCATIAVNAPGANTAVMTCTIRSAGYLAEHSATAPTIALHRSSKGVYRCVVTGFSDQQYVPVGCSSAAGADDAG